MQEMDKSALTKPEDLDWLCKMSLMENAVLNLSQFVTVYYSLSIKTSVHKPGADGRTVHEMSGSEPVP
jgi:hypothetical protein